MVKHITIVVSGRSSEEWCNIFFVVVELGVVIRWALVAYGGIVQSWNCMLRKSYFADGGGRPTGCEPISVHFCCCWCGSEPMQVLEKACIACSAVIIQTFLVCTKLGFHWIVLAITWQIIDSLFEVESVVSMFCAILILPVITTFTTHRVWGRQCALWWIVSSMFNFLRDLRE